MTEPDISDPKNWRIVAVEQIELGKSGMSIDAVIVDGMPDDCIGVVDMYEVLRRSIASAFTEPRP